VRTWRPSCRRRFVPTPLDVHERPDNVRRKRGCRPSKPPAASGMAGSVRSSCLLQARSADHKCNAITHKVNQSAAVVQASRTSCVDNCGRHVRCLRSTTRHMPSPSARCDRNDGSSKHSVHLWRLEIPVGQECAGLRRRRTVGFAAVAARPGRHRSRRRCPPVLACVYD
jgi:hypothetical protein